ncbi:MAG: ribosomal subunit interface protein [Halobacteriovoraceae bacterium]|nr:ribosomal subunit interface protein [Halobacteriovoraceae bacterium]|tara:strand:- start:25657 stop:26094 length:438 start_codon:yes stop_codon:yes gene_type:complete
MYNEALNQKRKRGLFMKITSTFKHLEHTEALDQKIQAKSQKLKKYFEGNFEVQWTCFVRDDGAHCAEIKLLGPSFEYHASAHSDVLYKTLDLAINKIEKQVHKKKDKWKNRISKKHAPSVKDQQVSQSEWDEKYWEAKEEEHKAS